jgi:tetrahydromethanopterin S-methyltransferase subunit B
MKQKTILTDDMKTVDDIKKLLIKAVEDSSPEIAKYVCDQVALSIAPLFKMLSELATVVERIEKSITKSNKEFRSTLDDHERRIAELEKLLK